MRDHSALIIESDQRSFVGTVDIASRILKYKALLFYAFDMDDETYSRFYTLYMPHEAQIGKLRFKFSSQVRLSHWRVRCADILPGN